MQLTSEGDTAHLAGQYNNILKSEAGHNYVLSLKNRFARSCSWVRSADEFNNCTYISRYCVVITDSYFCHTVRILENLDPGKRRKPIWIKNNLEYFSKCKVRWRVKAMQMLLLGTAMNMSNKGRKTTYLWGKAGKSQSSELWRRKKKWIG